MKIMMIRKEKNRQANSKEYKGREEERRQSRRAEEKTTRGQRGVGEKKRRGHEKIRLSASLSV